MHPIRFGITRPVGIAESARLVTATMGQIFTNVAETVCLPSQSQKGLGTRCRHKPIPVAVATDCLAYL